MTAAARRRNRAAIDAGTVRLLIGDAGSVPAPAASYQAALAVHTIYFWLDLDAGLRESTESWCPAAGSRSPSGRPNAGGRGAWTRWSTRSPPSTSLIGALGTAGFVEPIVHEAGFAAIVVATVPMSAG
jgi:hypothetical protein